MRNAVLIVQLLHLMLVAVYFVSLAAHPIKF